MVEVAVFEDPVEAAQAQDLLDARGIRTALVDREPGPDAGAVFRHVYVRVPADEVARANEILNDFRRSRPDSPDARRAMYAALFVFTPLQLYPLWLVARLLPRWHHLTSCDRRRLRLAVVADAFVLLPVAVLLYWLL
jgi:hypothetical protein